MNTFKIFTSVLTFTTLILFFSCSKEDEPIPDKSIGEWQVYSISNSDGSVTVWEEIKASLVELIPEYSCMEFTASITEQIVSTKYVIIDQNSRGCLSPAISVYTWSIDSETGFYQYVQGNNVINYLISFSNSDNRMTWKDQTSGTITVWDRVVTATAETTE
jgi:hypothetical protein